MSRVYGENIMSDDGVREWCRKFKDGRTDVHDGKGEGCKSVATEDLVQRVPSSFWSSLNGTCHVLSPGVQHRLSDESFSSLP
ncbi:hypothetical protein AVEN_199393-1 [Araneus ventricosus]|uniref:Mos1 transposase HTH domain-containing protein n=1 Tax=Araneus ventricosus TaxID=182803 RepID=A0A4Y2SQY4_ARAVE|nr:hypothetical protein AVEN_199393-1 [Araneus ventricosus]